jgi:hypothetical protein
VADHIRQLALNAVKTKLAGACELVGGRVWLTPRPPLAANEAPCIVIAQSDEDGTYVGDPNRIINRAFDVDIMVADILTRGTEDTTLLQSLNAIAVQVETAMVPAFVDGQGLGLGELDIRYVKTGRPTASALGDDIAEMPITFRITLPTAEGVPTKSIYSQS